MKLIEYKGESLTVGAWAKKLGIKSSSLSNRLDRGWPVERALGEKIDTTFSNTQHKTPSKGDAELWLNDQTVDTIPKSLRKCLSKSPIPGKKFGNSIRTFHREVFNKWFEEEFLTQNYAK